MSLDVIRFKIDQELQFSIVIYIIQLIKWKLMKNNIMQMS